MTHVKPFRRLNCFLGPLFFCLSAVALLGSSVPLAGAEALIRAGLSRVDITPPIGGKTRGYASAGPSTGVHDPLYATVLVLEASDTRVALVCWDLCREQSPRLHEAVAELGITQLLLCSSHTHAGPILSTEDFPSKEEPWLRTIEKRVHEAIREACADMFPAYFAVAEGSIQLGYNRLVRGPDGVAITYFNNPQRVPYGPVDPTVGLIRISDEAGVTRAVLVHYACHAVVLGPGNTLISADYVGAMRKIVEEKLGHNTLCLFVQGCCGDINPLIMARTGDPEQDFPLVETMGSLLAEEVLETFETMKEEPSRSEDLRLKSDTITVGHRWEPDKSMTYGVTSLLINGSIGIVTIPGEPFIYYQEYLRGRAELPHVYLVGYTDNTSQNSSDSYFPDIVSAAHAGYGASDRTSAELGAGERLVNQGLVQLFAMRDMYKNKPWQPPSR